MPVRDFPQRSGNSGDFTLDKWLDLVANRLNIDDQIELTSVADEDELGIFDVSANAFRKITKANLGGASAATQAEMEAASITTAYSSPGRQHFHPGANKAIFSADVSGGVPSLAESYNISSITDSGVGKLTVNLTTGFSPGVGSWTTGVERASTALAEANDRKVCIENGSRSGSAALFECFDSTATTMLVKDPAAWMGSVTGDQA